MSPGHRERLRGQSMPSDLESSAESVEEMNCQLELLEISFIFFFLHGSKEEKTNDE